MLRSVFTKTLHDARRNWPAWALGVVATVAFIGAVYPSFRDSSQIDELLKNYPDALKSLFGIAPGTEFSSGQGYLQTELFSFMLPILLLVAAISWGARAIAGEEESGTLDLLLTLPCSRTRVYMQKIEALLVLVTGLGVVAFLALCIADPLWSLRVPIAHLAAAVIATTLLVMHLGAVALAVGAARGHRGLALGTAAGISVIAFLWNGLAPLVSGLADFRWVSPWYHALGHDPLGHGLDLRGTGVLLAASAAWLVVGGVAFSRRDIGR